MNFKTMLADFLSFGTPKSMHKARFSVLLDAVIALTKDVRCTVTAIGRAMPGLLSSEQTDYSATAACYENYLLSIQQ